MSSLDEATELESRDSSSKGRTCLNYHYFHERLGLSIQPKTPRLFRMLLYHASTNQPILKS